MIIIWDDKTGRREFIEMLLKEEGKKVYALKDYSHDFYLEVKSHKPDLIICSQTISEKIKGHSFECPIKVLGSDISLPIEPISFFRSLF